MSIFLHDWLVWRSVSTVDLRQWQQLSTTSRSICGFVLTFLRELRTLDLSGANVRHVNLNRLAPACPNLVEICLNTLLITSHSLTHVNNLSKLQALQLRECPLLTDAALHSIFSQLELRLLDVSWAAEFSDAPWGHAPTSLREFRGVGCEHLTERVVVHLSTRCPNLEVLHSSRHINWIGAARTELLTSLRDMKHLEDVAFQDIPLDDDLLYTLARLPALSRLELWSYNSEQYITDAGVICLATNLANSLTKLSLDSFVFHGTGVLVALSSCWSLQELLLEGTSHCFIGRIDGVELPRSLVKLRLPCCGLVGFMDLSQVSGLQYLWLFDNPGLQGVQGAGQHLKTLNLGSTSCRIQGFRFDELDLLDLSSTGASEKDFEAILLDTPVITRAVLGNNVISPSLLEAFVRQAPFLRNLSLCAVGGLAHLARLLTESSVAPKLELLEVSEDSCTSLAEWLAVEQHMVLRRSGDAKDIDIWTMEQLENSSPYGRVDGADDSWLPAFVPA